MAKVITISYGSQVQRDGVLIFAEAPITLGVAQIARKAATAASPALKKCVPRTENDTEVVKTKRQKRKSLAPLTVAISG